MKKLCGLLAVLLLVSSPVAAAAVRVELKASYFHPAEKTMLDIYGGGPSGGAEIDIRLWKGFDVWLGGSFFSKEGELTFTKEKTKLQLRPLGAGLKFRWTKGIVRLYTASGLSAFQYKESNPLGEFNTTRLGLMGELGGYVKISGGLSLDLFVGFCLSDIEGPDYSVDVSGVVAGLGLAYQF